MGNPFKLYKLIDVNANYFFRMATNSDWVTSIESHTDVKLADATEQKQPVYSVGELLRTKKAYRIKIAYLVGTKRKYANIIVSENKVLDLDNIVGLGYGGGTVKEVIGKRTAKFS